MQPPLEPAGAIMVARRGGTLTGMDYGDRLKTAMSARGVKAPALADHLGISYQAVRKVLIGDSKAFTAERTWSAAKFLRVDADWLATGKGAMEPAVGTTPTARQEESGTMALSIEERDFLVAWRVLPPDVRERVRIDVLNQARTQLAALDALLKRQDEVPGPRLVHLRTPRN